MSIKIYFDMDGVLADFEKSATEFLYCHSREGGNRADNDARSATKYSYAELNRPSELLTPDQKQEKIRFWQSIGGTDFFKNLPVMPGANAMLDAARKCASGGLYILTKAPSSKNFIAGEAEQQRIAAQKIDWVLKHFADYFPRDNIIVVIGIKKNELVRPTKDDILIDDRTDNIEHWNTAGGTGILFTSSDDATTKLVDCFNKI